MEKSCSFNSSSNENCAFLLRPPPPPLPCSGAAWKWVRRVWKEEEEEEEELEALLLLASSFSVGCIDWRKEGRWPMLEEEGGGGKGGLLAWHVWHSIFFKKMAATHRLQLNVKVKESKVDSQ